VTNVDSRHIMQLVDRVYGQKATGQKVTGQKTTKNATLGQKATGQKATTLVFHWRNLKSSDYVFTYATADECCYVVR